MKKVWLITGCSTGFGRELATYVLAQGFSAAVAARNTADVHDIVAGQEDRAIAVQLDVTKPEQIKAAVQATLDKFGRIDVLVNNAGIGYFGAVEESEEAAVRNMFEINFFGLAKMTQAVLPIMRAQRSGHDSKQPAAAKEQHEEPERHAQSAGPHRQPAIQRCPALRVEVPVRFEGALQSLHDGVFTRRNA